VHVNDDKYGPLCHLFTTYDGRRSIVVVEKLL
jgi:hypothetical protein